MTIHEMRTELEPAEVIERARGFFALSGSPYAAFVEQAGANHLRFHLEVGEVVVAAGRRDGVTVVRGSASRGAHLLTAFLSRLGAPLDAKQTVHRRGVNRAHGAATETCCDRAATPATAEPRPLPQAA